jgi:hypothetical protein
MSILGSDPYFPPSEFSFESFVENGGEEGVDFGGGLGWHALSLSSVGFSGRGRD